MRLYHSAGECFEIGATEWEECLRVARDFGWTPAGTARPPVRLDAGDPGRWNGAYEGSAGQTVVRKDAAAFGLALMKGVEMRHPFYETAAVKVKEFASFCLSGSFVISDEPAVQPDLALQLTALHQAVGVSAPVPLTRAAAASSNSTRIVRSYSPAGSPR